MDEICERCHSSIQLGEGQAIVKVTKPHVFCRLCFDKVQTRWFRRIQKYFPHATVSIALGIYIVTDFPEQVYLVRESI